MITREFDLMLYQEGNLLFINANQYDSGEQWIFTLYEENGVKYTPATGAIVGVKSDGKGIINTGTVDEYGRVVINETQQMTAAAGLATFELLIDNDTHGTANFKVDVEPRPADNADLSDSDLSLVQQAIDSAEVIVEVIGDGDPSEVIGEHVDAWLDNHPEATTTVLDGAITAPKINNSLWDKLLVNEEASGAVASFDDGADDVPVSSLKVALEPIQTGSGDPSPSNVRPIIAANGINRLSVESVSCGGDNTRTKTLNIETISAGTYTFSAKIDATIANNAGIQFLDANSANVGSVGITPNMTSVQASVTLTGDAVKAYFYIGTTDHNNGKYLNITNMQMGVVNAPYQPYQGIMVERTGKNLIDINNTTSTQRVTFTGEPNDFTLTATGTYCYYQIRIPCKANRPVTVHIDGTSTGDNKRVYISHPDSYSNFYRQWVLSDTLANYTYTFTPTEDSFIMMFYVTAAGTTGEMHIKNLQAEYGSEATEYEPYQSASYPYSLGQSVYGGTVDLATGELTVTDEIVDLGSLTWNKDTNRVGNFYATITGSTTYDTAQKCSSYKVNNSANANTIANGEISSFSSYGGNRVFVKDTDKANMTTSEFKTAMNGVKLVYELANQQTYQLTPTEVKTLLGYNNISSSGTVDVIYHADTKLYVDKMTAVDNNIIAPTEADFVATRNYTVNDLLIVADTLYKVTTNIASGSAITPNSNVTQTTLGALIKALS